MSGLRVVFFGMEGIFSRPPLAALVAGGCDVCAVVVPRPAGVVEPAVPIRTLAPPARRPHGLHLVGQSEEATIIGLAWQMGITVLEVARVAHAQTRDALRALQPDILCVACFPRLLPSAVLDVPRYGALNVHPSLLPAYRGPAPLFWVFHDGLEHAGVTVHLMDAGADTGDVVAQQPVALPDGISYDMAERACAEEGGRLLVEVVRAIEQGRLSRRAQPATAALPLRAPVPRDEDFVVTPAWPARRAFNFIRGMRAWDHPVILHADGERLALRDAISFDEAATMDQPVRRAGAHVQVRCSPGVLTVTLR